MRGADQAIGKLAFVGAMPTLLIALLLEISEVDRSWVIAAVVTSIVATILIGYWLSRWK